MKSLMIRRNLVKRNEIAKNIGFVVATVVLSILIALLFSMQVHGQMKEHAAMEDKHKLDALESQYIHEIKNAMAEAGCEYAGITMTKIIDEENKLDYQVLIHHENIKYLEDKKLKELEDYLGVIVSDWENTSFSFQFSYE